MKQTIEMLENKIKTSTNPYKIKALKEEISWAKAEAKGNYVTKEHLAEYRNLIIWKIKNSLYFNTSANLVKVMNIILARVEANNIVFRTEKGIKALLMDAVVYASKSVCMDEVVAIEGNEVLTNCNLRADGSLYSRVQSYYLNIAMGN